MAITKVIACSDIHIPKINGISDIEETLSKFIERCKKIVKEEESPENIRIVVCGDIFHNKIDITGESMTAVHNFFKELDNICKTFIITGNHDYLMNNANRIGGISAIFKMAKFKQVYYLDEELDNKSGVYKDDNVAWCLYSSFSNFETPNIEEFKKIDKDSTNPANVYIGLIHGDINGAITTTNRVTENEINPNVFEECDFVIAGHIHKRQEIKKNGVKIVYCSSLKQQNFGESITGHGFVLWDIEDNEDIEYKYIDIPNEDGGFYKFSIDNITDLDNDKEELLNY